MLVTTALEKKKKKERMQKCTISTTALSLAKKVVSSTRNESRDESLQQLTQILSRTNPPPFRPRVPRPCAPDGGQRILQTSIERRADTILPQLNMTEQSHPLARNTEANRTYGSTPADSIYTLLEILYPKTNVARGSFIDGGSGMGIPTLTAALSQKFRSARGIEYETKWYQSSTAILQAYREEQKQLRSTASNNPMQCELDFKRGDMTEPGSFEGASCVFFNSVTWDAKLCQKVSRCLEQDLKFVSSHPIHENDREFVDDVFVISMSRRLALPSFDLVDVVRLKANGGGLFTFYVNRLVGNPQSPFSATSDSEIMRTLREEDDGALWDDLLDIAMDSCATGGGNDPRIGFGFLVAIAASEPSTHSMTFRQNSCYQYRHHDHSSSVLWDRLKETLDHTNAGLPSKVLGSMVLRAMVDHPVGRRMIGQQSELVELLVGALEDGQNTKCIHLQSLQTNYLDIVSHLMHDAPLDDGRGHGANLELRLDNLLDQLPLASSSKEETRLSNLYEAAREVSALRQWWQGHPRKKPF